MCWLSGGATAAAAAPPAGHREWSLHIWPRSRPPGQNHGPGQRVSDISQFCRSTIQDIFAQNSELLNTVGTGVCVTCGFWLLLLSSSHIMEHLEGMIDKPEKEMTPQELQLHYFKMHDYDGNNLLDGLELATAISHVHREVGIYVWMYTFIYFCSVRCEHNACTSNHLFLSSTAKEWIKEGMSAYSFKLYTIYFEVQVNTFIFIINTSSETHLGGYFIVIYLKNKNKNKKKTDVNCDTPPPLPLPQKRWKFEISQKAFHSWLLHQLHWLCPRFFCPC